MDAQLDLGVATLHAVDAFLDGAEAGDDDGILAGGVCVGDFVEVLGHGVEEGPALDGGVVGGVDGLLHQLDDAPGLCNDGEFVVGELHGREELHVLGDDADGCAGLEGDVAEGEAGVEFAGVAVGAEHALDKGGVLAGLVFVEGGAAQEPADPRHRGDEHL